MKPLLAATPKGDDLKNLSYPVWVSPKLDGIRCLILDGEAVTRTLKPIPNDYIRRILSDMQLDGLDGEIIVGSPTAPDCYNVTQSGVMSKAGEPDFTYRVFDVHYHPDSPFGNRFFSVCTRALNLRYFRVVAVPHEQVYDYDRLLHEEERLVKEGYEGAILRSPDGTYKYGRSTIKQGFCIKLKRFADGEAHITGVEELLSNQNSLETDELGYAKRSTAKSGQVRAAMLGSIIVQDAVTGVEFGIGSGFSLKERVSLWDERDKLIGRMVKYKHFPVGAQDKPRFPTWLGFRDKRDM